MADPVSWLQIEQGWTVVTADGAVVGAVAQVEGDKQDDIFDGLAVQTPDRRLVYVPGEQVGTIVAGQVTSRIAAADVSSLEPFQPAAPQTTWRPGKAPLTTRLTSWLRGRR
jgi:hypothetical protein